MRNFIGKVDASGEHKSSLCHEYWLWIMDIRSDLSNDWFVSRQPHHTFPWAGTHITLSRAIVTPNLNNPDMLTDCSIQLACWNTTHCRLHLAIIFTSHVLARFTGKRMIIWCSYTLIGPILSDDKNGALRLVGNGKNNQNHCSSAMSLSGAWWHVACFNMRSRLPGLIWIIMYCHLF